MKPGSDHSAIEEFVRIVLRLDLMDSAAARRLAEQARSEQCSFSQALLQSGRASPVDVDLVDMLLRAEDAIPGYEIMDLIGRGGMGVVLRARQKSLNRIVALKTVLAGLASDPMTLKRFQQEAVTIAKLAHPNIVNALDFGRHQGRLYLAMEIIEGEDLNQMIDRTGPMDESLAWGIGRQIAAGLAHACRSGVIHRDIKPANVLLVPPPDGHSLPPGTPMVKLTDFGLALLNSPEKVHTRLTTHNSALGSPHYMAPEQLGHDEIDTRADIHALGATLFHMLAGQAPLAGKSLQQILVSKVKGEIPDLNSIRNGLSSQTVDLVHRMMATDRELRPADYQVLLEEIDRLPDTALGQSSNTGRIRARTTAASLATEEFQVQKTLPVGSTNPIVNLSRKPAIVLSAALMLFVAAFTFWLVIPKATPIMLGYNGNELRLFDGERASSVVSTGYASQRGGWTVTPEHKLVHIAGTTASLTWEMPEWQYWSFELVANNLNVPNRTELHFGVEGSSPQARRIVARIADDRIQMGISNGFNQAFQQELGQSPLDSNRNEHTIQIEKNNRLWIVRLNGNPSPVATIPISGINSGQNQLTLYSGRPNPLPSETQIVPQSERVMFSEIVVNEMIRGDR